MIINPSSLKKVAIAIHKDPYFYTQNFSYIPFLNVFKNLINKDLVKVYTPSLDFFDQAQKGSLTQTAHDNTNYYLGMINSVTINKIDLFQPVNTFTYSDFIALARSDKIKTTGSLTTHVLVPYVENDQNSYFQQLLWRLAVYQFVPFFLNVDVNPKNLGGPLFVEKFDISLAEGGDVSVTIEFEGGSQILPPSELPNYDLNSYRQTYRTAKNYDCILSLNVAQNSSDINASTQSLQSYFVAEGINILSMNLSISNSFTQVYTANDGVNKFLSDGIKFLSYKKRKVTGSFKFISSENLSIYFSAGNHKQFILYFGGPFYFPMSNVTLQSFDVKVDASSASFVHVVEFIALLQASDPDSKEYYNQNEFDVNRAGLYAPVEATIYTEPQ
jgi:hypothetical protein